MLGIPVVFSRWHSNIIIIETLSLAALRSVRQQSALGVALRDLLSTKLPQLSGSSVGPPQKQSAVGVTEILQWIFWKAKYFVPIILRLNMPLQRTYVPGIGRQVNFTIPVRKIETFFLTKTHDSECALLRNRDDAPHFVKCWEVSVQPQFRPCVTEKCPAFPAKTKNSGVNAWCSIFSELEPKFFRIWGRIQIKATRVFGLFIELHMETHCVHGVACCGPSLSRRAYLRDARIDMFT